MAAVGLANRQIKVYKLDGTPQEVKQIESPLKFQVRYFTYFSVLFDCFLLFLAPMYCDIQGSKNHDAEWFRFGFN